MLVPSILFLASSALSLVTAAPTDQILFSPSPIQEMPSFTPQDLAADSKGHWDPDDDTTGEGHLSQWSRQTKVSSLSLSLSFPSFSPV